MFAIAAVVLFGLGVILNGEHAQTNAWLSPTGILLAGLTCLALHLSGTSWTRRP